MSATRKDALAALKAHAVPALRGLGFKGSMPRFHRVRDAQVDLCAVQFSSGGGCFAVELGYVDGPRENVDADLRDGLGDDPARYSVTSTRERLRLGAASESGDHWFIYDTDATMRPGLRGDVDALAGTVARLLREDGEAWWRSRGNPSDMKG